MHTATDGVRSTVIRPGVVHGRGGGIPATLVGLASEHGGGRYIRPDDVRWPMVHVADLADLYVAVLDRAPAGTVFHGVAEELVPVAHPRRCRRPRCGCRRIRSITSARRGPAPIRRPLCGRPRSRPGGQRDLRDRPGSLSRLIGCWRITSDAGHGTADRRRRPGVRARARAGHRPGRRVRSQVAGMNRAVGTGRRRPAESACPRRWSRWPWETH